jgi:hypothetical protein
MRTAKASRGVGILQGTLQGDAAITNEKLDLTGLTGYFDIDAEGKINAAKGSIEFDYYPNYTGNPSTNQRLFTFANADGSNLNSLYIEHDSASAWRVTSRNSAGAGLQTGLPFGTKVLTAGTKYHISYNWDFINGEHRLFIDGVQQGGTQGTTGPRSDNLTDVKHIKIGHATLSDNFFQNFQIFSEVRRTANFTPTPQAIKKYIEYDPLNNIKFSNKGTVRFHITPKYTGSPSENQYFIFISKTASDTTNLFQIVHKTDGNIEITIKDDSDANIFVSNTAWTPTKDTEYEIEVNFDVEETTADFINCYIQGTRIINATDTSALKRDDDIGIFYVGASNENDQANVIIDNLLIFDEIQHTGTSYIVTNTPLPENLLITEIEAGTRDIDYLIYTKIIRIYEKETYYKYYDIARMILPEKLITDLDVPELPEDYHEVIMAKARIYFYKFMKEIDLIQYWTNEYNRLLSDLLYKENYLLIGSELEDSEYNYNA